MKKEIQICLAGLGIILAGAGAGAAPNVLPMRFEKPTKIHGGSTQQIVGTNYGANLTILPFTGTTTYDFYSTRLGAPANLKTKDKASGRIYMRNTSNSHANDFEVMGYMTYFDYDPVTGTDVFIGDTRMSPQKKVTQGNISFMPLSHKHLDSNLTIPPRHLLHVQITILLLNGNPGASGELLYNGPQGTTTEGELADFNAFFFAPPQAIVRIEPLPDSSVVLTCTGFPGDPYGIEACTDLGTQNWVLLGSVNATPNGYFSFTDTEAANYPARFYRTVAQ